MKHILILITRGDTIGGAQTHILTLADKLREKNKQITFIIGGNEGPLSELLKQKNFRFYLVPSLKREISPFFDIIACVKLYFLIRKISPDVISIHSTKAGILGRTVSYLLSKPVIFTAHGWAFTEGVPAFRRKIYSKIERVLTQVSTKVIAVSEYDKELAIRYGVCKEHEIVRIHNGVENNLVSSIRGASGKINIGMVARFDVPKDQKSLILAVQELEGIQLHLWGDGPNLSGCKQLVEKLNLVDKVIFHGHTNNILESLSNMDVFALISSYEGFPISTIEAMSVGLPVIVSDVGGAGEAVSHGLNGFILESNNPSCISEYLTRMISDESLRRKMGAESKRMFLEHYSADIMANKTLQVFEDSFFTYKK